MKVRIHEFRMGDCEDPEIYAAQPLYEWQKSEQGRWVMGVSKEIPTYHIEVDHEHMGYKVSILADIDEEFMTYFYLRWPK